MDAVEGKRATIHCELCDETGAVCSRAVVKYVFPSHSTMVRLVGAQNAADLEKAVQALPYVAPRPGAVKPASSPALQSKL